MSVPYMDAFAHLAAVAAYLPVPHPFAMAYLLAVAGYLVLGLIVLAVALLLAIWPPSRRTGRRMAGGVVGSLPFLFFFQGLSLPVLVAIGSIPFFLGIWSGPADAPNMIAALSELALTLAAIVAASIAGLIRVGASVGGWCPAYRFATRYARAGC